MLRARGSSNAEHENDRVGARLGRGRRRAMNAVAGEVAEPRAADSVCVADRGPRRVRTSPTLSLYKHSSQSADADGDPRCPRQSRGTSPVVRS